jgi:hypothetical protein
MEKTVAVIPSLRDIFGPDVADKVCELPVVVHEIYDYQVGQYEQNENIQMDDSKCCIVGAFLRTAKELADARGVEIRTYVDPYPDPDMAIEQTKLILGRGLSGLEKRAIRKNIREWDIKKNRRALKRALQVKRECAPQEA